MKEGYLEYKKCVENGVNAEDLAHVKGYRVIVEQMLADFEQPTIFRRKKN